MATINLDTQVIQNINSEISSLDTSLLNNYLPELETELNSINSNGQGDELHSIINTINQQFASVKSELSTALPKLENFLESQMTSYGQTEEELDAELTAVLQKMALLSGEGSSDLDSNSQKASSNETNSDVETLKSEIEQLKQQNAELNKSSIQKANDEFLREAGNDNTEFAERVKNDWSNVGEAYQDGLLSGVANTLGAALTTTANGIGWAWNQTVNCAEWALGAIGLGKGTIGDAAAWIIS